MKDYAKLLPGLQSEELARHVLGLARGSGFVVYKCGYYKDPLSGEKREAAVCRCTACGGTFYEKRAYHTFSYGGFGVWLAGENRPKFSGDKGFCPLCGAEVWFYHTSVIGTHGTVVQSLPVGSFMLLDGAPAFVSWIAERRVFKNGTEEIGYGRNYAYVFDADGAHAFRGRQGFFYGNIYYDHWEPLKAARDAVGGMNATWIAPVTDALFGGTVLENAKIERYLNDSRNGCYPVQYLLTYLKHPNAENLVTSGLSIALNSLIEVGPNGDRHGMPDGIDWTKNRPFEMLRFLSRGELRDGIAGKWEGRALSLHLLAVKKGIRDAIGRYDGWQKEYRFELLKRIIGYGIDPDDVMKYLRKQNIKNKPKKGDIKFLGADFLTDYWRMAKKEGMPLKAREDFFPMNLRRAHDQATALMNRRLADEQAQKEAAKAGRFEELAEKWAWTFFGDGSLMVRIAASPFELIYEGKTLGHCVASYVNKHAEERGLIFFVRKMSAPAEPYFTLELDPKRLDSVQNRGRHNCAEPEDVVAFRKTWLEWIKEQNLLLDHKNKKRKDEAA